jgi:hypothetical protein
MTDILTFKPKPNQHQFIDLDGQVFTRLTVLGFAGSDGKHSWRVCGCSCGQVRKITSNQLRSGKSRSCGCLARELTGLRSRTHNKRNTNEFRIWSDMRNRCQNPNNYAYKNYGGRGIQVCSRWESFQAFYDDMGTRPSRGHSIDRINNDGNYEPDNCRWATWKEQQNNRRNNVLGEMREQPLREVRQ